MVLRHLVMLNCRFGAVFVCDFADEDSFATVWIRRAGVVSGWVRVPGGGTRDGFAHGWCLSG